MSPMGEASSTRSAAGAKKRSEETGHRSATPRPPSVKASRIPWEAIATNRNRTVRPAPAPRLQERAAPARATAAAAQSEWVKPRWPSADP